MFKQNAEPSKKVVERDCVNEKNGEVSRIDFIEIEVYKCALYEVEFADFGNPFIGWVFNLN